jgi:ABC-type transport system involved in multi-copper enzyme maturation permease subunit/uncharacterized RDD family membrane protein YckC
MPGMSLLARAAAVSPFRGLSPFGPIFGKELRVTSRRRRTYALRVGYLALLLMAMLLAYSVTNARSYGGVAQQAMRQAQLGHAFFVAFSIFCIWSMGLIGPVLTANAIGGERLAKTLPVLLMTPITAWQVVAGKLLSRALTAVTLIGLSLPVLALVRLLGGVELGVMLAALAVAVSYMLACAALGLFYSLFVNRAAVVILLSYATLGALYALLPAVLFGIFRIHQWSGGRFGAMEILIGINPPAWAVLTAESRLVGVGLGTCLPCVLVQLGLAAGLVLMTAILLRRQFRAAGEDARTRVPTSALTGALTPAAQRPAWDVAMPSPGPGGDPEGPGSRSAPRATSARPVSDHPVLWRETRRPLFAKVWQRAVAVCVVLAALLLMYGVLGSNHDLKDVDSQIGFATVFCLLWWLVAAVLSATAISQEKESDTWTLLLTTPLTGNQIVFGKAAGLLRRMLWPTILVAAHFLLFAVTGVIPFWSVLFAVGLIVSANTLWVATGVWVSLRVRRVTFAVIANLLLAVAAYGLLPLAAYIPTELVSRRNGGEAAEQTMWVNPYYFLGNGFQGIERSQRDPSYYGGYNYGYNRPYWETPYRTPGSSVSAGPFAAAAATCAALHLLAAWLVLRWTAAQFDEIVGRAGRRRFPGSFDSDDSVLPELAAAEVAPGGWAAEPHTAPATGNGRSLGGARAAAGIAANGSAASTPGDPSVYAGVWRRAAAAAIDVTVVGAACGLAGVAWGVVTAVLAADAEDLSEDAVVALVWSRLVRALWLGLLVGWAYFAGYEASAKRATPGKAALGLFVTDTVGRRATLARTSLRYLVKLATAVPLLAGFAVAAVTRRKQGVHDLAAGTLVLRR